MAELFDIRSEFFRAEFQKASSYDDYIKSGTQQQLEKWQNFSTRLSLTGAQKELIGRFKRELNLLVLSGIWCGDCARQGPMLDLISKESSSINLRFIDNQSNPKLRDELRISGGSRVPVVVALSEDFFELARFGDRHLSVYRQKALTEVGAACDPGLVPESGSELAAELAEWLEWVERVQLILRLSPFLRARHKD